VGAAVVAAGTPPKADGIDPLLPFVAATGAAAWPVFTSPDDEGTNDGTLDSDANNGTMAAWDANASTSRPPPASLMGSMEGVSFFTPPPTPVRLRPSPAALPPALAGLMLPPAFLPPGGIPNHSFPSCVWDAAGAAAVGGGADLAMASMVGAPAMFTASFSEASLRRFRTGAVNADAEGWVGNAMAGRAGGATGAGDVILPRHLTPVAVSMGA
jgi:hypothetical protein